MNFKSSIFDFLNHNAVKFEAKELDELNIQVNFEESEELLILAGLEVQKVNDINRSHIDKNARVVWEDQWQRQPKAVESRIMSLLKKSKRIHARETKVESINKPQLQEFLAHHHVSQPANSKTKLGLFYKDELVAVSAFGKSCPIDTEKGSFLSIELIRFCNISGATVVGGMSKMMKRALIMSKAEDIMTYADLDWSTRATYELLGFFPSGDHPPVKFSVNPNTWERTKSTEGDTGTAHLINRGSMKYNTYVVK